MQVYNQQVRQGGDKCTQKGFPPMVTGGCPSKLLINPPRGISGSVGSDIPAGTHPRPGRTVNPECPGRAQQVCSLPKGQGRETPASREQV